jgi:hypothetical protein
MEPTRCEKTSCRVSASDGGEKTMKKLCALALLALSIPSVATAAGLPFTQDDYGAALVQAKQRQLPIFVEVWAPW